MPAVCRLGDKAKIDNDDHGCPHCPHVAIGPAVTASSNVLVNGVPALRLGDVGIHASCCGQNMWRVAQASGGVLVNGSPIVRKGDLTQHCGGSGMGKMIDASGTVFDNSPMGQIALGPPLPPGSVRFNLLDVSPFGGLNTIDVLLQAEAAAQQAAATQAAQERLANGLAQLAMNNIQDTGIGPITVGQRFPVEAAAEITARGQPSSRRADYLAAVEEYYARRAAGLRLLAEQAGQNAADARTRASQAQSAAKQAHSTAERERFTEEWRRANEAAERYLHDIDNLNNIGDGVREATQRAAEQAAAARTAFQVAEAYARAQAEGEVEDPNVEGE